MSKKRKKHCVEELPKYEDWLVQSLRNKKRAAAYLQTAIEEYQEDNDPAPLLLAFRHVAMAQGGVAQLAKKTNLNRETLYRTLSRKGNPRLQTLGKLLNALGFHLAVIAN
ncbi:MAG TPA: addiction module antidote protein [Gammaproteobacteria bacterium]|nr:addiction module antidote protein [Gammaproteobacteria bacterium]